MMYVHSLSIGGLQNAGRVRESQKGSQAHGCHLGSKFSLFIPEQLLLLGLDREDCGVEMPIRPSLLALGGVERQVSSKVRPGSRVRAWGGPTVDGSRGNRSWPGDGQELTDAANSHASSALGLRSQHTKKRMVAPRGPLSAGRHVVHTRNTIWSYGHAFAGSRVSASGALVPFDQTEPTRPLGPGRR